MYGSNNNLYKCKNILIRTCISNKTNLLNIFILLLIYDVMYSLITAINASNKILCPGFYMPLPLIAFMPPSPINFMPLPLFYLNLNVFDAILFIIIFLYNINFLYYLIYYYFYISF